MVVFPEAKINLGLHITGKRSDGYHDIETIMYPAGLCDALEIVPGPGGSAADRFSTTGLDIDSDPGNNLVIRAVEKMRHLCKIPFLKIHLHKVIPPGGGLGGGSSDAASAVKVVSRLFSLHLSRDRMREITAEFGSDCPFFVDAVPACATGKGDILQPVTGMLKGFYLLMANPGITINTSLAYRDCLPLLHSEKLTDIVATPPDEWKERLKNDFEETVFRKYPVIGSLKQLFYDSGAVFSLMSGSGSTVYGIFREKPEVPPALKDFLIYEGFL